MFQDKVWSPTEIHVMTW